MNLTKAEQSVIMIALLERKEYCRECAKKSLELEMQELAQKWTKKEKDAEELYWKIAATETA